MARPSTPDNVQAVLVIACQILTDSQRRLLRELLAEQQACNSLGRNAAAATTELAAAVTALAGTASFVTAMSTAGYD